MDQTSSQLDGIKRQLILSPPGVRRKHADRLEALLLDLDRDREYSLEFLYYRITGFRPAAMPLENISGETALLELRAMLEDISASVPLPADSVPEKVYSASELADRFDVSRRTIYRWRERGLIMRKYNFGSGQVGIGARESAVERFMEDNRELIKNSSRFQPLSAAEKRRIAERGRELAQTGSDRSITAIARHIAGEVGRAPGTVRRLLRKHHQDSDTPFDAHEPLKEGDQGRMFDMYREGVPVREIAEKFGRSRSSVYRILNKYRARTLLGDTEYISTEHSPEQFDEIDRDRIFSPTSTDEPAPLRLYHCLKFDLARLRESINPRRYVSSSSLDALSSRLQVMKAVRRRYLASSLTTILEAARQHTGAGVSFPELVDLGCLVTLGCVDKFDYRRQAKFNQFTRLEMMKTFARSLPSDSREPPRPAATADEPGVAAARAVARRLEDLTPEDIPDETMARVMETYELTLPPTVEILRPLAEEFPVERERIKTIVQSARTDRS
ncbi:MAG: helix-turn-helix domain-containing protein [Planctomycetota bacterium]